MEPHFCSPTNARQQGRRQEVSVRRKQLLACSTAPLVAAQGWRWGRWWRRPLRWHRPNTSLLCFPWATSYPAPAWVGLGHPGSGRQLPNLPQLAFLCPQIALLPKPSCLHRGCTSGSFARRGGTSPATARGGGSGHGAVPGGLCSPGVLWHRCGQGPSALPVRTHRLPAGGSGSPWGCSTARRFYCKPWQLSGFSSQTMRLRARFLQEK